MKKNNLWAAVAAVVMKFRPAPPVVKVAPRLPENIRGHLARQMKP